ncbi:hypothetical protein NQD34_009968 [Periophthalmus magnuspinnatus]|nr:hypothetical protein NQD34_009968 [Periophthalmus magnuspinnatus]
MCLLHSVKSERHTGETKHLLHKRMDQHRREIPLDPSPPCISISKPRTTPLKRVKFRSEPEKRNGLEWGLRHNLSSIYNSTLRPTTMRTIAGSLRLNRVVSAETGDNSCLQFQCS